MGVFLALLTLVFWGFGDFLIQKSARRFGDSIALFYITFAGMVGFFPWAIKDLKLIIASPLNLFLLLAAGVVIFFAAMFDFEGLRKGKMSVIEPVLALEVIVTTVLASLVLKEFLTAWQILWLALGILGILLVSLKSLAHLKKINLEKGVIYALFGALAMGFSNFLFGWGSRQINPIVVNWFTDAFVVLVLAVHLTRTERWKEVWQDWRKSKKLILGVSILDNMAWLTFSYSMLLIPIAIATGISESYIALAAALGLIFNKEKLKKHQWWGLVLAIVSVVLIAFTVSS
ncbi:MAG: DMT family transporter [Candidatus Yanofskybacteria bacterium]|nr:DMT family transporter [Candidatus Yanofskybacteria bacterium]